MPRVRRKRSVSTPAGPTSSEIRPCPIRRLNSICHRRSWACTYPSANSASGSAFAVIVGTPAASRTICTGADSERTASVPSRSGRLACPYHSHRWTAQRIAALFELPFNDLLYQAQSVHRRHFDPNAVQVSTLLSIKTGGCPENCGYCSQSAHHKTGVAREALMSRERVLEAAGKAKRAGATRFCMGAAWRGPNSKELADVIELIKGVRELGMETCVTLGMLRPGQAEALKEAGLDYYHH